MIGIKDYPEHFHKSFLDGNEGLVDPAIIRQQLKNSLEKGKIDQQLFDKASQQLDALINKSEFSSKQKESLSKLNQDFFDKGEMDEDTYDDSFVELCKGGEGSRGGKVVRHTKSGKPVYSGTAEKQADQFGRMMENWHHNAEKSGQPEHHAIASKQALVSAYYHHHAGDKIAAHQAMDYANYHRAEYEKKGHKSRTATWVNKKHGETAKLIGHEGYKPEDHGVAKAEDIDISKAGEGSRGGHVIGHTKSGKPVYANDTEHKQHYKNFSVQDHFDASKLHADKANEHEVKHRENERFVDQHGDRTEMTPVHRTLAQHHHVQSQKHAMEAHKKSSEEQKNSLSSDEKKILADQKKKQIAHHEAMEEHHNTLANLSEKSAEKHKGSDNEKYMREVSDMHKNHAAYHKREKENLEKEK